MNAPALVVAVALGVAAAVLAWVGVLVLSPWVLLAWPALWLVFLGLWLCEPPDPACRVCGCTDGDYEACVDVTGAPCWWVEPDLCSRCTPDPDLNERTV